MQNYNNKMNSAKKNYLFIAALMALADKREAALGW